MKTLLDLGACYGDFTTSWLEKNPDTQVLCVEPNPGNVEILYQKFQSDPRVEILPLAVACESGTATFYLGTSGTNGSLSDKSEAIDRMLIGGKEVKSIEVPTKTILQLFDEYELDPNSVVLKIDVEGFEHRLLCQMLDENIIPHEIYMEDGCRKTKDVEEWHARLDFYEKAQALGILDRLGFEINVAIGDKREVSKLKMPRSCENRPESRIVGYVNVDDWYAYRRIQDPASAIRDFTQEGIRILANLGTELEQTAGISFSELMAGSVSSDPLFICFIFDAAFKSRIATTLPESLVPTMRELVNVDFNTGHSDLVTEFPLGLIVGYCNTHKKDKIEAMAIPLLNNSMAGNITNVCNSRIWYEAAKTYFQYPKAHFFVGKVWNVAPGSAPVPPLTSFDMHVSS